LIRGYGLVNTSGPDYAPLEIVDQNATQETDEERGRAKFRSLFPGVYVTVTLEGSYKISAALFARSSPDANLSSSAPSNLHRRTLMGKKNRTSRPHLRSLAAYPDLINRPHSPQRRFSGQKAKCTARWSVYRSRWPRIFADPISLQWHP